MRAFSLPSNLLAAYIHGSNRQLGSAMGAAMGGRQLGAAMGGGPTSRRLFLGDSVIDASTGDVVGDTGDVSSLPVDYSAGIASGQYYVLTSTGASSPATLPGSTAQPSSFLSSLVSALPSVSSFLTAQQLAQVNVQRAKQGLPALQTSQYAPQVGVNVAPATMNTLLIGAIAVAGILVFLGKKKR